MLGALGGYWKNPLDGGFAIKSEPFYSFEWSRPDLAFESELETEIRMCLSFQLLRSEIDGQRHDLQPFVLCPFFHDFA